MNRTYSVTDFLDVKQKEISDRLKELAPLVDEYSRLRAAAAALDGVDGAAAPRTASAATPGRKKGPGRPRGSGKRARKATQTSTPAASSAAAPVAITADAAPAVAERKKPGRPKGSGKKVGRAAGKVGRPKGKVGRRKGSGTRAAEALTFVQGQPGITIPELAAKMGIKQNYLYRLLPGLEKEGKLEKKGRGWHPKSG
jgi:hypothetical protein